VSLLLFLSDFLPILSGIRLHSLISLEPAVELISCRLGRP